MKYRNDKKFIRQATPKQLIRVHFTGTELLLSNSISEVRDFPMISQI